MVNINEDFKPAKKYTGYLLIATLAACILIWAVCVFWIFIPGQGEFFIDVLKIIAIAAIAVI
ncbi:MAG: hypothetical protein Q4Q04_00995, partial [Methanocorpusculum sp.]|nr:hypothetical protein [Methanocorpusculum sp.]